MKKNLLLIIMCLYSISCFGWGQKGHDTVAFIAENHLTDKAKAAVEAALGGKSLVYYSNWLDNASHTREYAYTKTWHYKNIDADVPFERAPLEEKGDIVTALNDQIALLAAGGLNSSDELLALKILIHLMGDLHQPMHLGHLSDLGGNLINVKLFNRDAKLHSVWDNDVVENTHKGSYREWQFQIDRATEAEQQQITAGTIIDWAKETYLIAAEIYKATPMNYKVSYDYYSTWGPVVELQLLRGGLRLASILNSIYDPQ